jgi:hypothetical protein
VELRGLIGRGAMNSFELFEPVDEDDDLEVAVLTSSREAFTGFSNLAAIPPTAARWQEPPWRPH